jgi:hypothetical protein
MRAEPDSHEHSPIALVDQVVPRVAWRVIAVEALQEFRLRVRFADGLSGVVDVSRLVHSPNAGVFSVLSDPARFAQVGLELGAVSWPGAIDLAPYAMHDAVRAKGEWRL